MSMLRTWAAQLDRSPVFSVLSPAARQALAEAGMPLRLAHGARLFSAGDPGDAAYLLLSGALDVGLSRADGHETWLASLEPGAVIGDMAVLDGGRRSADITATRASELLRFNRAVIIAALSSEPQAAMQLLALLVERLRSVNALVEAVSVLDVGARLARILIKTEKRETRSQSELARVAGTTRESVNRQLAAWRAAGWIDVTPRGIELRDPLALRREARFDTSDTDMNNAA